VPDRSSSIGIIVGFASAGRPAILAEAIAELSRQTHQPTRIIVSVPTGHDAEGIEPGDVDLSIIKGLRGLTLQRNAVIRTAIADARESDLLVFFDDDFFPEPHYLEELAALFVSQPDVVMSTGAMIADGILGPGLAVADARALLAAEPLPTASHRNTARDVYNAYGCNMAIRIAALRQTGVLFDERLPLYGWLEDIDFSRAMAGSGRIVHAPATRGVHLGVKSGRQSGVRLGYSQIANPIYLMAKHRCARTKAVRLMACNLAANLVKTLRPEPFIDRGGRLSGNLKALGDLFTGRLRPEKAAQL
jgi:GT2 family glycosyltransferase